MSHNGTEVLKTNLKTFNKIASLVNAIKQFYYSTACQYGTKIKVQTETHMFILFLLNSTDNILLKCQRKSQYIFLAA